jgi:hypothetical protein
MLELEDETAIQQCHYCRVPLAGRKIGTKYCNDGHRKMFKRNGTAPLPEVPNFPRDLPNIPGARENYCAPHDEIYLQFRPAKPSDGSIFLGLDGGQLWMGECSECAVESSLRPAINQQLEEQRQEIRQRVKLEMERRKDEIAEAVEEKIAPEIAAMREQITEDITELVEASVRDGVVAEMTQEIFQRLKIEAPRKVKAPWQQLTATPAM